MLKFTITDELAKLIKTLRIQNKISSKNLANHINKSTSYISRLESGGIKMVQKSELTEIFSYIVEGNDFYQDKLPSIIQTLASFITPERVLQQLWLLHYDGISRPITIPANMIQDMLQIMDKRHFTISELVTRINQKPLYPTDAFPSNEIAEYSFQGTHSLVVRITVDESQISALLSGENPVTNHCTIHNIVSVLLRPDDMSFTAAADDQERLHLQNTNAYLQKYGIFSLTHSNNLITPGYILTKNHSLSSEFTLMNQDNIDAILKTFEDISIHNNLKVAQALDYLRQDLEWDPSFLMELLGIPFHELGTMSFHLKKELLDDIRKSFKKYSAIPKDLRHFEQY